jgi:hypothetical protein
MRNAPKFAVIAVSLASILVATFVYAVFHGYFDRGMFEIKQIQWSPAGQAAMVAERSDEQALSGYTYFVLIGDHVFSPSELRHAYHSNAVVFAAGDSCLNLHWQGPAELVIACNRPGITRERIDVQKNQRGKVAILYENISIK